jgi:hypothetical protein
VLELNVHCKQEVQCPKLRIALIYSILNERDVTVSHHTLLQLFSHTGLYLLLAILCSEGWHEEFPHYGRLPGYVVNRTLCDSLKGVF